MKAMFLPKVLAFWGQWSKSGHKQCKPTLSGGSVRRQTDLNEQSLFSFFVLLQFPADHPKFLHLVKQTNIPQQLLPHAVFAWKARLVSAFPQEKPPLLGSRPIPGAGSSLGGHLSGQPRGGTTHHVTHLTHEFLRFVTVDQIFHLPGKILHFLRIHKVLHFVGCIRKTLGSHNVLIFCGRRWQPMGEERNKMQAPNRISQMTHTRCECMAVQTKGNPC